MLDGLRVLDLSRVIAGPYCTREVLGELGVSASEIDRLASVSAVGVSG